MQSPRRTRGMRFVESVRGKDLRDDITELYWPLGVGQPGGLDQAGVARMFLSNKRIADYLKKLSAPTISHWMKLLDIPTRQSMWTSRTNGHQP